MSDESTPVQNDEAQSQAIVLSRLPTRPPLEVPGYDMERFLGKGAFGEVWVGLDRNTGKLVAIKFYGHRKGLDWSQLAREVQKLRMLANDRYVVQLVAVGWEADPPYYVMEYMENGSLEERLREGPLSVKDALELFRELAVGLQHAHGRGVLHCDLKPANILLDLEGKPRLADFGQARLTADHSPALGTLFYMAPEQANLEAAPDARWDVYALGAVLYCMLTGEPPYRSDQAAATIKKTGKLEERLSLYRQHIRHSPLPKAHRELEGIDSSLADLVDRCLARDKDKRFANVQAVIEALDARALRRARRPLLILGAVGPALLLLLMLAFTSWIVYDAVQKGKEHITLRAQDSNQTIARFAADQIAAKINQRWVFLDREAVNPDFQGLIQQAQGKPWGDPAREELQKYLETRAQRYDYAKAAPVLTNDNGGQKAVAWFLVDRQGKLLAASPLGRAQKSMDRYFWHRDFFHGKGYDLKPEKERFSDQPNPAIVPIETDHQSTVFRTTAAGEPLMVVFSVPVWNRQTDQVLGVLAMGLQLGGFSEIWTTDEQAAEATKVICLAIGRRPPPGASDIQQDIANEGLVLEHPALQAQLEEGKKKVEAVHLPAAVVDELQSAVQETPDSPTNPGRHSIPFDDYRDPLAQIDGHFSGRWLATAEPVVILKRVREKGEFKGTTKWVNTGWVVIAQENYESAVLPVKALQHTLMVHLALAFGVAMLVVGGLWVFVLFGLDASRSRLYRWLRHRAGLPTVSLLGGTAATSGTTSVGRSGVLGGGALSSAALTAIQPAPPPPEGSPAGSPATNQAGDQAKS